MRYIALAIVLLLTTPDFVQAAQPVCTTHDEVVKQLGEKFHETSRSVAFIGKQMLLEVFRSEDGSTWTIVVTKPDGTTCVVASGTDWQDQALTPVPQSQSAPEHYGYPGVGQNAQLDPNKQFEI